MNIDPQLDHLASLRFPQQVDVVDGVMQEVLHHPYMLRSHRNQRWRRFGLAAAAAALLAVAVNVAFLSFQSFDEEGIGSALSQVNDYSSWNTVEEAAPIIDDYLFEDEDEEQ